MPTTEPDQSKSRSPSPAGTGDVQALAEQVRLFMIVLFGLVIVAQLPLPFRLAGILLALVAGWVGIRLLVRAGRLRKVGVRARGSLLVALGLGLSCVLLVTLGAEAAYYPLAASLERCRSGANTQTAAAACEQSAKSQIDDLVNRLSRPR